MPSSGFPEALENGSDIWGVGGRHFSKSALTMLVPAGAVVAFAQKVWSSSHE